jgi:hypothetical protein
MKIPKDAYKVQIQKLNFSFIIRTWYLFEKIKKNLIFRFKIVHKLEEFHFTIFPTFLTIFIRFFHHGLKCEFN